MDGRASPLGQGCEATQIKPHKRSPKGARTRSATVERTAVETIAGAAITLPPPQLFKTASPSVYAVLGQATALATSQGSAVAVSSEEAITNCHVVARAKTITLANATTTLRAEIIAADRKTDRCYLRVLNGKLEPVPGFRDYSTLSVGEAVFTIGSPAGLINTLGQGLLSGLRRSEDNIEYIQITAPVSPGSSGGGVFDDRGNLIGITTFTIRDAQNLNFAIAASHFWR